MKRACLFLLLSSPAWLGGCGQRATAPATASLDTTLHREKGQSWGTIEVVEHEWRFLSYEPHQESGFEVAVQYRFTAVNHYAKNSFDLLFLICFLDPRGAEVASYKLPGRAIPGDSESVFAGTFAIRVESLEQADQLTQVLRLR